MMHPKLNTMIDFNNYNVTCHDGFMLHSAPTTAAAAELGGVWAFVAPTTALNVYDGCLLLERIVPVTPKVVAHESHDARSAAVEPRDRVRASSQRAPQLLGWSQWDFGLLHQRIDVHKKW